MSLKHIIAFLLSLALLGCGAFFVLKTEKEDDASMKNLYTQVEPLERQREKLLEGYSKYGAVGLLIGMVICALIVLILDYMNDIIQSEDYLIQRYDAPLLASIPDLKKKSSKYGYYKK